MKSAVALCIFLAAAPRMQEARWIDAEIRPQWETRIDAAVDKFVETKSRYQKIQQLRPAPSVPAEVIFVLHGRESTWSFHKRLHEGSPLTGRTKYVPKGRPKAGSPPFTFEESAEDALYKLKDMENWDWSTIGNVLQNTQKYNGMGYWNYHRDVNTPYNYSGTDRYLRGKYISDGRFSQLAVDKQLGCAAILKRMEQRGLLHLCRGN